MLLNDSHLNVSISKCFPKFLVLNVPLNINHLWLAEFFRRKSSSKTPLSDCPSCFNQKSGDWTLNKMNCLAYWYQYQPKFYNWLLLFLEKAQTTGTKQNFIICCQYFSCYLFVSLWHCCHMSLSYLLSHDGLIFLFFVLWGLRFVVVS